MDFSLTAALSTSFSFVEKFPLQFGDLHRVCSPWLQMLNCNSLLITNKPIFAGQISSSLFVLREHFGGPYGDHRRLPMAPGLVSKQVLYSQMNPLQLTAFSMTLGFEGASFSWIWAFALIVFEALNFIQDLFKSFVFFVKALFCIQVLIWHLGLILRSNYFTEIDWLWSIPFRRRAASPEAG